LWPHPLTQHSLTETRNRTGQLHNPNNLMDFRPCIMV
jgi:hypothetical protein